MLTRHVCGRLVGRSHVCVGACLLPRMYCYNICICYWNLSMLTAASASGFSSVFIFFLSRKVCDIFQIGIG